MQTKEKLEKSGKLTPKGESKKWFYWKRKSDGQNFDVFKRGQFFFILSLGK